MGKVFGLLGNLDAARRAGVPLLVAVAIVMVGGFSMTGCASDPDVNRGGWTEYSFLPGREFVVVGTVVVRDVRRVRLLDELMTQALEMGAHDIINVRVGMKRGPFGSRIRLATAVAIRYTGNPSGGRGGGDAARVSVVIYDMAAYSAGLSYTITVAGDAQGD